MNILVTEAAGKRVSSPTTSAFAFSSSVRAKLRILPSGVDSANAPLTSNFWPCCFSSSAKQAQRSSIDPEQPIGGGVARSFGNRVNSSLPTGCSWRKGPEQPNRASSRMPRGSARCSTSRHASQNEAHRSLRCCDSSPRSRREETHLALGSYGQAVLAAGVLVPPSVQPRAPLIRMRPAEPPPPPPLSPWLPPT